MIMKYKHPLPFPPVLSLFRMWKATRLHKNHWGKCGCWRSVALAGQLAFPRVSHMWRNSVGSRLHHYRCSLLPQVSIHYIRWI